jgi:dehydrogenase/reductase SDR family member 7B
MAQVVWITGASSGIGAALAKQYARAGANLILSGRRQYALEKIAAECLPAQSLILLFEATDYDVLSSVVEQAIAWRGHVDVLVNNAGISQRSLAIDTDFKVYRQLMEVDFFGPLKLTQLLLPHFIARKSGALVQISSVAGKVGAPLRTGYCAVKHALVGYSDALRAEVAQSGIKVHVVTPGFIATPIAEQALTGDGSTYGRRNTPDPTQLGMNVDAAAQVIMAGIRADKKEIPVGQGKEMQALWLKRFWPSKLFSTVELKSKA